MGGDLYSATMVKSVNDGVHSESLAGREEFLFSSLILGENNNERLGIGLFGNDYTDADRPKGAIYENAAVGVQDANGNWVAQRGVNGNIIYSQLWLNPQQQAFDGELNQARYTYDASFVKLREIVFGYTFPKNTLRKLKGIKNLSLCIVALLNQRERVQLGLSIE